jgi:hypothetical protein
MSSVVISGNTSGTITLDAPAVAGTTTLTLPATSGTVVTKDTNGIASVNGIQFPATQSASADANCLDDYEEGSWTPAVTGLTASNATGTYTKIGRLVTVGVEIGTFNTTRTSADIAINNLPFTSFSTSANLFYTSKIEYSNFTFAAGFIDVHGRIPGSATYIQLLQDGGGGHDSFAAGGGIANTNSVIRLTISYFTS